ncbi:MAG: hypothetical protein HZR80_13775 [Candidatus Heimdallarchaeota archaeon]
MIGKAKYITTAFWFATIIFLIIYPICYLNTINVEFDFKSKDALYISINNFSNFTIFENSPEIISNNFVDSIEFHFLDNYTNKINTEVYSFSLQNYSSDFNISILLNVSFNRGLLGDVFFYISEICHFSVSDFIIDSIGKFKLDIYKNKKIDTMEIKTSINDLTNIMLNMSRRNNIFDFIISVNDSIIFNILDLNDVTALLKNIQLGCRIYPFFNDEIGTIFSNINAEFIITSESPPTSSPPTSSPPTSSPPTIVKTSLKDLISDQPLVLLSAFLGLVIFCVFIVSFVIFRYKNR